jgi:hypothetical protein
MRRFLSAAYAAAAFLDGALTGHAPALRAQDIEPRAYSTAPVGVNFLTAGYAYTRGAVPFETLPVTDAQLTSSGAVFAYARALDLWGTSGKFDVIVPFTSLSGTAHHIGDPVERTVDGFGDSRNSVKLYASSGVAARTGNNLDLLGIAWQHRWGGGL